MRLRGVLSYSLGGFLCIRGFAEIKDLCKISKADDSYQRDLIKKHVAELESFLEKKEYMFFPEVVLGTSLDTRGQQSDDVNKLYEAARLGEKFALKFDDYTIANYLYRIKKDSGGWEPRPFQRVTITIKEKKISSEAFDKFVRIDGNHRLSAAEKDIDKIENYETPFCLILFRNKKESKKYSKILFHNINFKAEPLAKEHNFKLILDDQENYSDEFLQKDISFGWPYYFARKLHGKMDYDILSHIKNSLETCERSFLVDMLSWLIKEKIVGKSENTIRRVKQSLSEINNLYAKHLTLSRSKNSGLLGAFLYYQLKSEKLISCFTNWVMNNHIHRIEKIETNDLVKIFNSIIQSQKRTIFVSMPFNDSVTENHYDIITRTIGEINNEFNLKVKIKAERVDWFNDGTSYNISDKILEMIQNCGLLLGNLTYCNPNVYHEIGFLMGKSKALKENCNNFILFLDEGIPPKRNKVGFNLQGIKQIRFKQTEKFASELKKHIKKFYALT